MSDVTMEQKLQLVRQIRSRYNENLYDLSSRERILYGRSGITDKTTATENISGEETLPLKSSFFRIRVLFAVLLLLTVVIMDKNGINVAGITTEKIYRVISADYEENIDAWVDALASAYNSPVK